MGYINHTYRMNGDGYTTNKCSLQSTADHIITRPEVCWL